MTCRCGSEMPDGAVYCPACGGRAGLGRWIPIIARLIAWALVVLALRLAFAGGWLRRAAGAGFEFVFGRSFERVATSAISVAVSAGLFLLVWDGLLRPQTPVFPAYLRFLGRTVSLLPRAVAWAAVALLRIVEGHPEPRSGSKGGSRRGG